MTSNVCVSLETWPEMWMALTRAVAGGEAASSVVRRGMRILGMPVRPLKREIAGRILPAAAFTVTVDAMNDETLRAEAHRRHISASAMIRVCLRAATGVGVPGADVPREVPPSVEELPEKGTKQKPRRSTTPRRAKPKPIPKAKPAPVVHHPDPPGLGRCCTSTGVCELLGVWAPVRRGEGEAA